MRAASSAVLVLCGLLLPAGAQEGAGEADLARRLRDLVRADEKGREEVLKGFREVPLARLEGLHALAARLGEPERDAARRWLPHPAWASLFTGTIGDLRRELKDLLKYNTPTVRSGRRGFIAQFSRNPGRPREEVRQALARLLDEGDSRSRLFALEAFSYFGTPDPKKLLPILEDPDKELAAAAAGALALSGDATLVPPLFKAFQRMPPAEAQTVVRFLTLWGTSDLVPDLLALLKDSPDRFGTIVQVLGKIGDERAEPALLERLEKSDRNEFYSLILALQGIGGARTIEAVRKHRASLPEKDERRAWETGLLFRLRDPALAGDLRGWLAERKFDAAEMAGSFLRVGDRSIVPDLVRHVREGRPRIEDRNAALHVIGVLGGPDETALLVEHLQDGRFSEAAAAGLAELRDPRSVKPLAEALKTASAAEPFVRALSRLPLAEAEASLLEILDDPEGHEKVAHQAVALAARAGSARLKGKLLEIVAGQDSPLLLRFEAARALLPLVAQEDRPQLRKGLAPADGFAAKASAFLLAGLGDPEGAKHFVSHVVSNRFPWRDRRLSSVLFSFSTPSAVLIREVQASYAKNPNWFDGAEFLAHQGMKDGEDALLKQLDSQGRSVNPRTASALLRMGNVRAVEALLGKHDFFRLPLPDEERLARALEGESLVRLRELARERASVHDQAPLRLLALRGDEASVRLFLPLLREDYLDNAVQPQSNLTVLARALARMKVKQARGDFLRLLRSDAQAKRVLGLECLAALGDPAVIPWIVPFLDDLQPVSPRPLDPAQPGQEGTVSEAAIRALEQLSGRTFAGTPRERARAARAWFEKEKR